MRSIGWAALLRVVCVTCVLGFLGCGDAGGNAADETNPPDEEVSAEPSADGTTADPQYIVYLQPATSNPLYGDVSAFVRNHQSEASFYPPHVTMTGFFTTTLSENQMRAKIGSAIPRHPLGQPKLTHVHCHDTTRDLITIHVDVPSPSAYDTLGKRIASALGLTAASGVGQPPLVKPTTDYHMTLFESSHPAVAPGTSQSLCHTARQVFEPFVPVYNRNQLPTNVWIVSLYRLTGQVGTGQLTRVDSWLVNP